MSDIEKLKNNLVGQMLCGKLLEHNVTTVAQDCIAGVRDECVHIAESMYIDCDPEQQATVDMVQRLIAENILRKLS